jgi:alkanesulfonate monooxygenase SsuD/methylene tetrahydromethanopterin reductase-like flavin-dependent oxidoreductase (luciferase family)
MSYAAACSDRIRIGCIAFVSSLHNPLQLAKSMATLDQLNRGRLEIGLATGGRTRMFSAFGVDAETFVARFTESLQLMKALWTEPRVTFEGRFWQLHAAAMEPKPFQKPHPPIWFGGSHPNALRRAVRYANGFFGAGSQTTAQFADQVKVVREALSEQNRDPGTFPIAKRVYIAVDDSTTRAGERITAALDEQYGYFGIKGLSPVAVAGPPDACVQGLREVFDAGAEMILLNPLFDDLQQMERLAAEVMPRLRGTH